MSYDKPPYCCYLRLMPNLMEILEAQPDWLAQGLDTRQAAKFLGFAPATLETIRNRGGGPIFQKFQRKVVYVRAELLNFMIEASRRSTSGPGRPGAFACACAREGALP